MFLDKAGKIAYTIQKIQTIMDKLDAIKVFIRVAETASFSKAANDLNLPRATVSLAVQQLEAQVGTRLLHRTTRRVQLTQDGSALLERCRDLLVQVDEIGSMFSARSGQIAGRLKVDVPSRIGRLLLAPHLPEFLADHPQLQFELGATDRAVDIVAEGVDVAIRVGPVADSSLVARPLGEFAMINCASPVYLAQFGTPVAPQDLLQQHAVQYASPTTGRIAPWEYRAHGQLRQLVLPGRVTVNNAESYVACALAGLGLVQIPLHGVRGHLQRGELVQVMPDYCADPMPVFALYSHRRHFSPKLQAFLNWFAQLLLLEQ